MSGNCQQVEAKTARPAADDRGAKSLMGGSQLVLIILINELCIN